MMRLHLSRVALSHVCLYLGEFTNEKKYDHILNLSLISNMQSLLHRLLCIGFSLSFAALSSKLKRINKLFSHAAMRRIKVEPRCYKATVSLPFSQHSPSVIVEWNIASSMGTRGLFC